MQTQNDFRKKIFLELSILSKKKHVVSGEGYECKKEVIILTTHKDFFGHHTYNINKTIVKLSREDCDHMVLTRRCDQILMQCQDN